MKDQITQVNKRLDIQIKTLDAATKRFENRDAALFKCVVKAISDRDKPRANIYASELWEIRKAEKMLMHASLALESISMRLKTVSEVGDLVTVLAPAANVLNNIQSGMAGILPQASQELENIGSLLGDIMNQTRQTSDSPVNIGTLANEEAEKILLEAEMAAEKKLQDQFPEAETTVTPNVRTSIEV